MLSSHLLTIKIGNTNIGLGIFEGTRLLATWRMETRAEKTADEYGCEIADFLGAADRGKFKVAGASIGSVVPPLTPTFQELCRRQFQCEPFVVTPGIRSGIKLHYEDPRALGSDRLVALAGAKARYGTPALVVDMGTATTFNALDTSGDFVGGAIAPGLNIQSEALHQFTARLPRVEIGPPVSALATNTRDALRSGLFFGYVGLIEGLVTRLRNEMGARQARVIATGGLAPIIAPHCPSIEIVDLELPFEGLRILYEMNSPR